VKIGHSFASFKGGFVLDSQSLTFLDSDRVSRESSPQCDQKRSVFQDIPPLGPSASFASRWPVPDQSAPACIDLHAPSGDGSGAGDDPNPLAPSRRLIIHERFFEVRSWSRIHPIVRRLGERRLRCPDRDRGFFGQAFSFLT